MNKTLESLERPYRVRSVVFVRSLRVLKSIPVRGVKNLWVIDETMTIREGWEALRRSRRVIVKTKWLFCVMKEGHEKERSGVKVIENVRRKELINGFEINTLIVFDQCTRPFFFLSSY